MAMAVSGSEISISWWKEPNKDQWFAWFAGAFGWMLDGFDFTIFLLIMVPIAQEFGVSVTAVASVLTVTLCCASLEPSVPVAWRSGWPQAAPAATYPSKKNLPNPQRFESPSYTTISSNYCPKTESATPGHPPVASLPAPLHGGNIGLICAVIAG